MATTAQKIPQSNHDSPAERSASETIARLQRGVLRLALAYHGRSTALDAKLKAFGGLVRQGRRGNDRQKLIDEIVDDIVSLDLEAKDADPAPATASEVDDFLAALDVPESLQPELERTRRLLNDARDRSARLAQLRQMAAHISDNLMRSADSCADAPAIRMLLLELLERMPVAGNLVHQLSPLRRRIERAHDHDSFLACVRILCTSLEAQQAALRDETADLAEFLKRVAKRLNEFDAFVNGAETNRRQDGAETLQLSETVRVATNALRQDVQASTDVASLKRSIDDRLDTIDSGLDAFVAAQQSRAEQAKDSVARMKQRLRELEDQAEDLREDLEQQHARVLIDPLTGVLNRSGYAETADRHVARWQRYGGRLSLAVIDLDLFKRINDDYGHTAGDRVLSTVAQKLGEAMRQSDVICRYGGEEFVLLLPETGAEEATVLLEKLRSHIERCPFRHKDTPVNVTISAGIAEFDRDDNLDAVFERADAALYLAKQRGRNRVCTDDPEASGKPAPQEKASTPEPA